MADTPPASPAYDKMDKYIESLFQVFYLVNKKAEAAQDRRLKLIGLTIFNYVRNLSKVCGIPLSGTETPSDFINLIPIFEYITSQDIELYDFSKIEVNDVDVTKAADLERFVLSHVYYITQNQAL
jgi:hypothetical protein